MRNFIKVLFVTGIAVAISGQALAQERGFISQNRAYKGYEKRQRVMPGMSSVYVSPSQLHEVYGLEVGAAGTYVQSTQTVANADTEQAAPGGVISTVYGGDMFVAGLDVAYNNVSTTLDTDLNKPDFNENVYFIKPSMALSFTDNVTLGVSANWAIDQGTQKEFDLVPEDKIDFNYVTTTAGISFHNAKMEMGAAYSTFAKDTARFDDSNEEKRLYVPAQSLIFVRGNLTDNWSVMATSTFVDYERAALASNPAFDKYRFDDRIGTTGTLTYWTQARSSVNVTAKYVPATAASQIVSPFMSASTLTNTYGGSLDYIRSFSKKQYAGLSVGYERGERDQIVDGTRYSAMDQRLTVGAMINSKI